MINKQIWMKKDKSQQPNTPIQHKNQQPNTPIQHKNQQPAKTIPMQVPEGHYFWKAEEKQKVKMAVIMDQHGEIFLLDKLSRTVYWSYRMDKLSYFLYKAEDVDDYIDFDAEMMFPFHHHGNRTPKILSFRSLDHFQERLEDVYRAGIKVEEHTFSCELDYQTGCISSDKTKEKLLIELRQYDTSLSSPEPSTLRWHLKFAKLKVIFPNTECPCTVYHARSAYEFIDLCTNFGIEELPGGRLVEDLRWKSSYELKKIVLDDLKIWKNDKIEGLYEGRVADVIRVTKSAKTLGKIRKLRLNEDERDRIVRFYGWEEAAEYYYLAFERCNVSLEKYVKFNTVGDRHDVNTSFLRMLAHGVYCLHAKGICHNDLNPQNVFVNGSGEPKLGWCSFEDKDYSSSTNIINILGRIMLFYASGGAYQFVDDEVNVSPDQLKLCNLPELRDLIKKLTSRSPPRYIQLVLAHPWLWDVHTMISFITTFSDYLNHCNTSYQDVVAIDQAFQKHNVFKSPWNIYLDTGFVNERVKARAQKSSSKYDFTRGSSLINIMRNGFAHHDEMAQKVREVVGDTKEKMLLYFLGEYPELVITLYYTGKPMVHARNLRIFYEN